MYVVGSIHMETCIHVYLLMYIPIHILIIAEAIRVFFIPSYLHRADVIPM
jgi:hypothetical protein